jgi:hypothetical protein
MRDRFYSCRQVYEGIKPKKRMAARIAANLFLGFDFVLTQSTVAIFSYTNAQNGVAIFSF